MYNISKNCNVFFAYLEEKRASHNVDITSYNNSIDVQVTEAKGKSNYF